MNMVICVQGNNGGCKSLALALSENKWPAHQFEALTCSFVLANESMQYNEFVSQVDLPLLFLSCYFQKPHFLWFAFALGVGSLLVGCLFPSKNSSSSCVSKSTGNGIDLISSCVR